MYRIALLSIILSGTQIPTDLSINKLYKMFKDENPQYPVKQSYFRHIFNREFNLDFGTPATVNLKVLYH